METVRIGVMIRDSDYRNALLRGLSHESRDFQFTVIAGAPGLKGLSECQIVLTDGPDLCLDTVSADAGSLTVRDGGRNVYHAGLPAEHPYGAAPVITLTHHEMYDMGAGTCRMEIFRYEDARVFISKIIYFYAKEKGIDLYFHGRRNCRKVVFSSLCGGCGTTSCAMTSARFLKFRFDKKVLFLSLCPVDGSREYTGACDGGNMLSLLYHLSTGEEVPLCKFISSQEGVDHIRGQRDNRAASEMTISEMKRLLKMIDRMGEYDYVVFDVSSHLSSLARFLMDGADVNVVIKREGMTVRDDGFDAAGGSTGNAILVTALGGSGSGDAADGLRLSYAPEAFVPGEERTYIDIRGKYGEDIGALTERIVGMAE